MGLGLVIRLVEIRDPWIGLDSQQNRELSLRDGSLTNPGRAPEMQALQRRLAEEQGLSPSLRGEWMVFPVQQAPI
jgi:hypothetical protein